MQKIERIARLYPEMMAGMGRLRALVHEGMDLTYNQYKTLLTIADQGECSLSDLARELEVAMSSASQMTDRLVARNLVHRATDAQNRRQVIIRLTEEGRALIGELQRGILAGYEKVLVRLPEPEQEQLVQAFETIAAILNKLESFGQKTKETS